MWVTVSHTEDLVEKILRTVLSANDPIVWIIKHHLECSDVEIKKHADRFRVLKDVGCI